MELGLNDFDAVKSITWAIGRVGSENVDFFAPKWHSLFSMPFQGQKSINFQGPPLSPGPHRLF